MTQEVYLVVHRKLATRDPAVPELAWVGSIALKVGLRYVALGRTREEQPMDEPDVQDQATAPDPSPEEAVSQRRRYHTDIEDVEPDRREVFEMYEIDGHSLPEIARALDKPLGTVTTRLRLAREDVTAAVSRMQAREARAEGRVPASLLLPFGLGGWAQVGPVSSTSLPRACRSRSGATSSARSLGPRQPGPRSRAAPRWARRRRARCSARERCSGVRRRPPCSTRSVSSGPTALPLL